MRKHFSIGICILIILLMPGIPVSAQNELDPYAETGNNVLKNEDLPLQIDPGNINVLSAGGAWVSPNLKSTVLNYMFQWVESIGSGPYTIEWKVKVLKTDVYDINAVVFGQDASIEWICQGQKKKTQLSENNWHTLKLGNIQLKEGINTIKLRLESEAKIKLSSIELAVPARRQELLDEAMEMRQNPDWFKDAGYGLMFQWTNRATPPAGNTIKDWEEKVNDFDVNAFVNMVEESGAAYVIWSITWGQQYISAPIKSLDSILEGRTSSRDLLGEMTKLLHDKGIKLIFYYHYGYDCYHSIDSLWLQAAGGYAADKTRLYENMQTILTELGSRYGDKLNGWFFDGGSRYYDCHFDGSSGGILSAPFKEISQAARTGNPHRIISYNSWILPRVTEYQDYFAGEGLREYTDLSQGVFPSGNYQGLMAHSCFTLERRWGHIDWNTTIAKPKYSADELAKKIRHAQKNRYPLSINLEMYEDGSVSPESLKLLKEVRAISP